MSSLDEDLNDEQTSSWSGVEQKATLDIQIPPEQVFYVRLGCPNIFSGSGLGCLGQTKNPISFWLKYTVANYTGVGVE